MGGLQLQLLFSIKRNVESVADKHTIFVQLCGKQVNIIGDIQEIV